MRASALTKILIAVTLLCGRFVFAGDAKPEVAEAQGTELHYWSGQTRVGLVLALDELQTEYDGDEPDDKALKAGVTAFEKIESVNEGKKQSRVLFKKAANPQALSAQAAAARKLRNVKSV